MKGAIAALCVLVGMVGFMWALAYNDLAFQRFFNPRLEQVRHDTFKQSQAYTDGMVNELQKLRSEYEGAQNQSQKDALADMIIHRASQFDLDRLPSSLRSFIVRLQETR